MAVIYEHIDDQSRPRIICDACDGPIRSVHEGIALIEEPAVDQVADQTRAMHSHKNPGCQANVRTALGQQNLNGMCLELSDHLVMMAQVIGLYPADFQGRLNFLLEMGVVDPPPPADEAEACGTGES
jgi:hypothetical protein